MEWAIGFIFFSHCFFDHRHCLDQLYQPRYSPVTGTCKGSRDTKSSGCVRKNLIIQFMVESFMLNLVALIVAGMHRFSPDTLVQSIDGKNRHRGFCFPQILDVVFDNVFGGSILSGLYPAFVLSGFQTCVCFKRVIQKHGEWVFAEKGAYHHAICNFSGVDRWYHHRISAGKLYAQPKLGVNINQTLVVDGAQSLPDSLYQNVFQPFKTALLQRPAYKLLLLLPALWEKRSIGQMAAKS